MSYEEEVAWKVWVSSTKVAKRWSSIRGEQGWQERKGRGENKKGEKLEAELQKSPRWCVCAWAALKSSPQANACVWAFFGGNYESGLDSPFGWAGCGMEATWAGWGGGLYAELSDSRSWKLVGMREWNYPLPQISRILVRATRVTIAFSDIFFQTEQIWRPHQLLMQRDIPRQKKRKSSPVTLGTGIVEQMCTRPSQVIDMP